MKTGFKVAAVVASLVLSSGGAYGGVLGSEGDD
jgi:hypothetical protein